MLRTSACTCLPPLYALAWGTRRGQSAVPSYRRQMVFLLAIFGEALGNLGVP